MNAISSLNLQSNLIILVDQDESSNCFKICTEFNINENQKNAIGTKEFEDAFSNEAIYKCLQKYNNEKGDPEKIQGLAVEKIGELRNETRFSEALSRYSKLGKPDLGTIFGKYVELEDLPDAVKTVLERLKQ